MHGHCNGRMIHFESIFGHGNCISKKRARERARYLQGQFGHGNCISKKRARERARYLQGRVSTLVDSWECQGKLTVCECQLKLTVGSVNFS